MTTWGCEAEKGGAFPVEVEVADDGGEDLICGESDGEVE